jgi:hypothetical protein
MQSTHDKALAYLKGYAKRFKGAFSPEAVIFAAHRSGIAFSDQRKWGEVFKEAAQEGHIRPSTKLFARATSNGSKRPGWIAN